MTMNLIVLPHRYSIYKFKDELTLPDWVYSSDFYSITKTKDELSVVAIQIDSISKDIIYNRNWRILKIAGPLDFSLVGIIAEISATLKNINIPIFSISTFETDYILVKQKDLNLAVIALREKGHNLVTEK